MKFRPELLSGDYEKNLARSDPEDVVCKMLTSLDSVQSCEWCCKALASLTLAASRNQDMDLQCRLLDLGICETLVSVITAHGALSSIVAAYGCQIFRNLASNSRDFREFLGESGACETVVFAMSMHLGDAEVTEMCTAAVGFLAKHDNNNSFRLAQAECCEVLAQAGNFGLNIRHPKCFEIAANVCYSLSYLSEAANISKLLNSGVCDLVIALCKVHIEDESVMYCALKCLCGLASLNSELRECLGSVGACAIIHQCIELHKSIYMVRDAFEVVMHLSLSPNNSVKFSKFEIFVPILDYLDCELLEVEFGVEICSGALLNLITYGDEIRVVKTRLIQLNCIDKLQSAKRSTRASYRARENIQRLLELLQENDSVFNKIDSRVEFVGVVLGSEYKNGTVPLQAELTRSYLTPQIISSLGADDEVIAPGYENTEIDENNNLPVNLQNGKKMYLNNPNNHGARSGKIIEM